MPLGGGKYDPEVCELLRQLQATGIVLLVSGGARGDGFSASTSSPLLLLSLPRALREVAAAIERDLGAPVVHVCGSTDPTHECCGYEPQGCCGRC